MSNAIQCGGRFQARHGDDRGPRSRFRGTACIIPDRRFPPMSRRPFSWTRGRVDGPGRHPHLGLGLYISRLIAEAHGVEIAVNSTEEAGTTFTFRLLRA
jgi:hypothetical protein